MPSPNTDIQTSDSSPNCMEHNPDTEEMPPKEAWGFELEAAGRQGIDPGAEETGDRKFRLRVDFRGWLEEDVPS